MAKIKYSLFHLNYLDLLLKVLFTFTLIIPFTQLIGSDFHFWPNEETSFHIARSLRIVTYPLDIFRDPFSGTLFFYPFFAHTLLAILMKLLFFLEPVTVFRFMLALSASLTSYLVYKISVLFNKKTVAYISAILVATVFYRVPLRVQLLGTAFNLTFFIFLISFYFLVKFLLNNKSKHLIGSSVFFAVAINSWSFLIFIVPLYFILLKDHILSKDRTVFLKCFILPNLLISLPTIINFLIVYQRHLLSYDRLRFELFKDTHAFLDGIKYLMTFGGVEDYFYILSFSLTYKLSPFFYAIPLILYLTVVLYYSVKSPKLFGHAMLHRLALSVGIGYLFIVLLYNVSMEGAQVVRFQFPMSVLLVIISVFIMDKLLNPSLRTAIFSLLVLFSINSYFYTYQLDNLRTKFDLLESNPANEFKYPIDVYALDMFLRNRVSDRTKIILNGEDYSYLVTKVPVLNLDFSARQIGLSYFYVNRNLAEEFQRDFQLFYSSDLSREGFDSILDKYGIQYVVFNKEEELLLAYELCEEKLKKSYTDDYWRVFERHHSFPPVTSNVSQRRLAAALERK